MERLTVTANRNVDGLYNKPTTAATTTRSTDPVSFPVKPIHHQHPIFPSHLNNRRPTPLSIGDSTELSIFTAERYFHDYDDDKSVEATKGAVEERSGLYTRGSSVSAMDGYGYGKCRNEASPFPTSSSEASWNSRSGLLTNPPSSASVDLRVFPPGERKKSSSSSACRWLFARGCPCSRKRSVQVEESFQEPKPPTTQPNLDSGANSSPGVWNKQSNVGVDASENNSVLAETTNLRQNSTAPHDFQTAKTHLCSPETQQASRIGHRIVPPGVPFTDGGGFSFPILVKPSSEGTSPSRESLEVFGPKDDATSMRKSGEFDHWKPLTGNNRRSFAIPGSPRFVGDEDMLSDSSSDLFEIESFSTQMASGPNCRRRDSLDEILAMDPRRFIENAAGILQNRQGVEEQARSSSEPSECYPPSEASVQWSVTTAEGFDRASSANFSSAASESEETATYVPVLDKNGSGSGCGKKKGGLLSCRSEKAVNANGPVPLKYAPEQRKVVENGGELSSAVKAGNGGRSSEKPPLARSRSARSS